MVDDGDEVDVAASSSTSLSKMVGSSATKASSAAARTNVAIRRRLSCVFLSASSLADVAPTPNTIPAVVGALMRETSSGILSLSVRIHCFNSGSHPSLTRDKFIPKKRLSLNASPTSFFQVFWLFCSLDNSWNSLSVFDETVSGNDLERSVGPITLVEIVPAAERIRSASSRILGRFGTTEANTETTSSGPSPGGAYRRGPSVLDFSGVFTKLLLDSANVKGLVVNKAASNRRNIS